MVLKNAAIVAWPLLAYTNRDNGGVLCVSLSSLLVLRSRALLKVSVLYLPCAVAYNPIRNTGTLLGLFAEVLLLANRKKYISHTEQSREISMAPHL